MDDIYKDAVSIHAPQEGCDLLLLAYVVDGEGVSIHAPQEGCDGRFAPLKYRFTEFQFTHPRRGATGLGVVLPAILRSFNSRTPGGVRRVRAPIPRYPYTVSIHAPQEGCDCADGQVVSRPDVSIHAPQEGCDSARLIPPTLRACFNSRTPGGVRLRLLPGA